MLDARVAQKPVTLVREGDRASALLHGPATLVVEVDFAIPVVTETGRASCDLPIPAAGTVRAILDLPGTQEARLDTGTIVTRTAKDSQTRIEATLEPGRASKLSWASRDAVAETPREARWLSSVRSLVTLAEADLRLGLLVEVSVMRGEPDRFELTLPTGYALAAVSGSTLESADEKPGRLTLVVREPARRSHQFALALERSTDGGIAHAAIPFPSVLGSSRETGELAIEGVGTLEIVAKEGGTARRMDVSEISPALRALGRQPLLAAFRFHRRANEGPELTVDVKRYPDAPVLAALAERMEATTLLSEGGRRLTELKLTVRNSAQPFVKVDLPAGATVLTAEVGGSAVKPVTGSDGLRIPLLRTGFRPTGPYEVSFVYLEPGAALLKSGEGALALPRLALPVNVVYWEVFAPRRCQMRNFGGNARSSTTTVPAQHPSDIAVSSGEIGGVVRDATTAFVPDATITIRDPRTGIERSTASASNGTFRLPGLAPGAYQMSVTLPGFKTVKRNVGVQAGRGSYAEVRLEVASIEEAVVVQSGNLYRELPSQQGRQGKIEQKQELLMPSSNVMNVQRRVAGVLPVAVDVPREGHSHRFTRALVLEDETKLTFSYKMRK